MDDELRMLHEAMVIKERLRVLAELQAAYWDELLARGFHESIAEQLMFEWSRNAYGMTMRSLPEPVIDEELFRLLGPSQPDRAPEPPMTSRPVGDPSRVPPGEPWLQLVQDADELDECDDAEPGQSEQDAA